MTFTPVPNCGYSSEEAKVVATTILEQVGGALALRAMTSASNFTSHNDEGRGALSFRFKGSRKVNYVKIILTAMDDYTLKFYQIGKKGPKEVEQVENIYCDTLADCFRRVTGLETRLPRFAR